MTKQKPTLSKGTIKRLVSYIFKKYKLQFLFVILCIIVSAVVGVLGSLFIKNVVDDYITPMLNSGNIIYDGLLKLIINMAIIYSIGIICNYLYNRIIVNISQGVLKDIRDEMFIHMQSLPISYFDTNSNGDIMSHYTNDTDTLRQLISQSIPQLISSFITIVTVFCAMIYLSIPLTIVVIISVFIMSILSKKITSISSKYFIGQQNSLGKLNGFIEEMIDGTKVIKVFTHEEESKLDFDKLNDELCDNSIKASTYANIMMPIMANIGNIVYILVAAIGGTLAINGNSFLTIGVIISFLQLTKNFIMPINQITSQVNMIIMALAGASRIFELIDEESEKDEGYVTLVYAKKEENKLVESDTYTGTWAWKYLHHNGNLEYIELKGDVRFFDVDFGYTKEKTILHNISLYAKPGQKIAFVGATGAGKTTITNLINRFYDIDDGKISYDGININKIKKADLRKSLGMVLQDTNLFTGTIMDNIRYGRNDATDNECIEAAKLANADDFIRMLPNGYDTVLTGNGQALSQGQRQLLSIARAAVANPPVMILDEATSSIDTRTEKIVQEGMDKLMTGRTVFVIAHRLSTVRNSKAIMVLENGVIIERGDHNQLIEQKGKYYQLYTGAFELE
jgi:ATP-binding cassette subfamily B protein